MVVNKTYNSYNDLGLKILSIALLFRCVSFNGQKSIIRYHRETN